MAARETSSEKHLHEPTWFESPGARAALLFAAVVLTFVLFHAPELRPTSVYQTRTAYQPPATAGIDDVQRQIQERITLELVKNAVGEIRQRQGDEDRWFDYKFILVGGLLGAFLARFAIEKRAGGDAEARLGQLISSNVTCCALAFATIVALIIDIHVRGSTMIIYQIGNWLAYFAEPTLLRIAFDGDKHNFLPWEMFLREPGGMHSNALYSLSYVPNLHLATLIIYVGYLGVLQEVSLKGRPTNTPLTIALFALVQFTFLLFAWMSHTGPSTFESQAIPFVDYWFRADLSGLLYILPWLGITALTVPYVWHLYRRRLAEARQ